jgi:hypothetical protein
LCKRPCPFFITVVNQLSGTSNHYCHVYNVCPPHQVPNINLGNKTWCQKHCLPWLWFIGSKLYCCYCCGVCHASGYLTTVIIFTSLQYLVAFRFHFFNCNRFLDDGNTHNNNYSSKTCYYPLLLFIADSIHS